MSIKEKTIERVESKIEEVEDFIAEKGVGSTYLSKAEKVQRDVNLALVLGGAIGILGITAWALLRNND